jgi:hypothetical protein
MRTSAASCLLSLVELDKIKLSLMRSINIWSVGHARACDKGMGVGALGKQSSNSESM